MEKPVAVIELGSRNAKVVIGYVIDDHVQVIYTFVRPYGHMINAASFTDKASIVKAIRELRLIEDAQAHLKINISDAIIALPPYGLKVFENSNTTSVISDEGKICNLDIKNVFTIIRNGANLDGNVLIDVVPNAYILDKGRIFESVPLGHTSSTLEVKVRVHSLPERIRDDYSEVFHEAEVSIKRMIVAPQGAAELITSLGPDYPKDYILVDVGSDMSTVTLVGSRQIYDSRFFSWGGQNITDTLIEKFNIKESEAEKLKMLYGFDKRELNFDPVISENENEDNVEDKHTLSEYLEIVKGELDVFNKELNSAITSLLTQYNNPAYFKLPLVFVGGGSALTGLGKYLEPKVQSEKLYFITPNTLGARNPIFVNCLGMIMSNNKHPFAYDDNSLKVNFLARENKE